MGPPARAAIAAALRRTAPRSISIQARRTKLDLATVSTMSYGLEDTLALMRDLRARCEWDAGQTHESLRPYLIEEAHGVDDAIRSGDDQKLREELGDLLLQVLFHSVVSEQRGAFDVEDVAETFVTKMKGRHP